MAICGAALLFATPALAAEAGHFDGPAIAGIPVEFILFAAANMRGHLRRLLQHPMLIGLLIWSSVHLLANGDRWEREIAQNIALDAPYR